jgi:predicted aldo/keto reductase-like oxidoreductase
VKKEIIKLRAINKIMTQEPIYQIAANFINYFNDNESKIPVAIAYAIQKNKQTFIMMAQEIE